MVPMHVEKSRKGAFHEPEGRARQSSARRLCIAKLWRARNDAPYRFQALTSPSRRRAEAALWRDAKAERGTDQAVRLPSLYVFGVHAPQVAATPRVLFKSNVVNSRQVFAPAERSGDGALEFRRTAQLTPGTGVARAPNPKRRGASLPAALQKCPRPARG